MKETGGPAFPQQLIETDRGKSSANEWIPGVMKLRQYAAIHLCIPDSGTDWLDEMIAKAERRDIAVKAIVRFVGFEGWSDEDMANGANEIADAVLKEQKKSAG